jgi:hypothetical protein
LDRWIGERRRIEKKKATIERMEREKTGRINAIRNKNIDERERRLAEQKLQASTDLSNSSAKDSTSASTKSKAGSKSVRSLNTGKNLPEMPSDTNAVFSIESKASPQYRIKQTVNAGIVHRIADKRKFKYQLLSSYRKPLG